MNQKPSGAFIAASWIALGAGAIGFLIGLWKADMQLNEKGYYFTVLMFGFAFRSSVYCRVKKDFMHLLFYWEYLAPLRCRKI